MSSRNNSQTNSRRSQVGSERTRCSNERNNSGVLNGTEQSETIRTRPRSWSSESDRADTTDLSNIVNTPRVRRKVERYVDVPGDARIWAHSTSSPRTKKGYKETR